MILETKGYIAHAFSNPIMALDHIKAGCPDCSIVLTDIRMQGMTGLELVMRLKRLRPEMKTVLMTGFQIDKEDLQKIIPSTTIDGFVSKPFTSAQLIDTIKRAESIKEEN